MQGLYIELGSHSLVLHERVEMRALVAFVFAAVDVGHECHQVSGLVPLVRESRSTHAAQLSEGVAPGLDAEDTGEIEAEVED